MLISTPGCTAGLFGLMRFESVPIETLATFMEAVAAHPERPRGEIAKFAGFKERTAYRALAALEQLGIVSRTNGGFAPQAPELSRGMDLKTATLVLRRALHSYRPFEALVEGLSHGESEEDAIRRATVLLGLGDGSRGSFQVLVRWGEKLGVLHRNDGALRIAPELVSEEPIADSVIQAEDVESEARARLYNAKRLGRAANNFLDEEERKLLAEALLMFARAPKTSAEKSGQALEDFLRELAGDQGHAQLAAKQNGAGQLAQMLVGEGVIHANHLHRANALAAVRTTRAHSKDKRTLKPWTIDGHGAFWAINGTLLLIRSVYAYVYEGGKQTI